MHHVRHRRPVGAGQQVLEAIGGGLAADFRDLPAVLALRRTEQAAQIRHNPLAGLRAAKYGANRRAISAK